MIETSEITPQVYRVDNGRGRRWTVTLSSIEPRIETESGARIRSDGDLGEKLLRLIALKHLRAP